MEQAFSRESIYDDVQRLALAVVHPDLRLVAVTGEPDDIEEHI